MRGTGHSARRKADHASRLTAVALAAAGALPPMGLVVEPGALSLPGAPHSGLVSIAMLILTPALAAFAVAAQGLDPVAARLRAQPSGEHRQIVARILIDAVAFFYVLGLFVAVPDDAAIAPSLMVASLGLAASWLFLLHQVIAPAPSAIRRNLAMATDIGVLSAFLHAGGGLCAAWYPLYFYLTIGSGFHFGRRALIHSAVVGAAGFAAVVATTLFWRQQPALSAGLIAAIVLLPVYVSSLLGRLAEARRAADAANAAKTRLLATLVKDLRGPLKSTARTGADIDRASLDPALWDLHARVRLGARAMLLQLDDTLNCVRIEDGSLIPETRTFDLYRLVNGAIAAMRPPAAERGIVLGARIDPRLPYQLRGWPHQLRQVLISLLTNVLRHIGKGKVKVSLDAIELAGDRVRLRIAISGDEVDDPPESDDEATAPTDDAEASHRLGLAMVDRLTGLMGGKLSVETNARRGLTLAVELPFAIDHALSTLPLDLANQLVLIVTRDAQFVGELIEPLEAWRADVRWIGAGQAAFAYLEALDSGGRRPVLVVDGRGDVLQALSWAHDAAARMSQSPYILFIADEARLDSVVGLADGDLDGILPAPFTQAALQSALHALRVEPADWFLADRPPTSAPAPAPAAPATPSSPARERRDEAWPSPARSEPPPRTDASARSLRILFAAPNAANRKIMSYVLQRAGHIVHPVENVDAGQALLDKREVDLLLLDLTAAAAGDYEEARYCRQSWPGLPIIALTGDSAPVAERLGREAGLDAVLTKPIEPGRLIAAIAAFNGAETPARAGSVVTEIASHPRFAGDAPLPRSPGS